MTQTELKEFKDLMKALVVIIDKCAERGAFRGDELLTVGTIRGQLLDIISSNDQEKDE